MKIALPVSLALAIIVVASPASAVTDEQHQAHHAASSLSAQASKATKPAKPAVDMARMDTHIAAMNAMHEKMMLAKTSEERNALMADQMNGMQEGMGMMKTMPSGSMNNMKSGDMAAHHQMMEKRMEMMQAMMQSMMDRMSAVAAPAAK